MYCPLKLEFVLSRSLILPFHLKGIILEPLGILLQLIFNVTIYFPCRLKAGWSSSKTSEPLRPEEQEAIISVIRRNEEIEVAERQRVGRLVERVEKIKQHAVERGPNCCRLCGDTFGILRPQRILCEDCRQSVCTKCSVDINIRYHTSERSREIWLCRICSETREMWKKSGAWFFKGLPKYDMPRSASATPIPNPGPGSMAGGWLQFWEGVFPANVERKITGTASC